MTPTTTTTPSPDPIAGGHRLAWLLLAAVVAALLGLVVAPVHGAHAGGWAMATLDSVPEPEAGTPVTIGMTVLQHGVTPVHPEGDVGIQITGAGGTDYFAAVADATPGHYTVDVTFPSEGSYTWLARLGWFPEQTLGTITVDLPVDVLAAVDPTPADPEVAMAAEQAAGQAQAPALASQGATQPDDGGRWPVWRWVLLGAGAVLLVAALVTGRRDRRRSMVVASS